MNTSLKDFLESDEGKKSIEEYSKKMVLNHKIKNSQLDRFHCKIKSSDDFSVFVEKVCDKYDSNKYRNFWYSKGIEPPEPLKFFLMEYAEKYGEDCTEEEFEKYGSIFTGGLFKVHGYYFNLIVGQGSFVHIIK